MYQDNKSTILMENNARASISEITKHIKSIYFLIKDHIKQGGDGSWILFYIKDVGGCTEQSKTRQGF